MCTEVHGEDPNDIGFSTPDELDAERIAFFKSLSSVTNGNMKNSLAINVNFDRRFMAKLGLGIGYCLFGKRAVESEYSKELRKGLWHRDSELEGGDADIEATMPDIRGAGVWKSKELMALSEIVGEQYAISLVILPCKEGVVASLNIGKGTSSAVMCASYEGLNPADIESIRDGKIILLYKHIQTSVSLSLPEYLSYKLGHLKHPRLTEINSRISKNEGYFRNL